MPIDNLQQAAQQIASLLNSIIRLGGLRLKYRISGSVHVEGQEPDEAVINVELAGPDASLLTQRGGEMLRALEHISGQILRLDSREHSLLSFDALGFKAERQQEIVQSAEAAAERVRQSGSPYSFPPTNSRERRMLHMAFKAIGDVETVSHGEGPERYLVVYPKGRTDLPAPVPVMPTRSGYGDRSGRDDRGGRRDRDDRGRGGDRPQRDGGYGRR